MEVVSRDHRLQNLDCSRHFGAIFLESDIVQVKVEHVPVAAVVAVRADLVLRDQVLVGVGGGSIRLEACGLSKRDKLFPDHICLGLKPSNPLEVETIPPRFQREPRHKVRASQLPRVVDLGHFAPVYLHEDPVSQALHCLVVRVTHLVFDELFAGQRLEVGQIVVFQNLVDLLPHRSRGRILVLFLFFA